LHPLSMPQLPSGRRGAGQRGRGGRVPWGDASAIATRGPLAEFIQYKTTRREVYEAFAKPAGCWDVVLFNEDGELTEASFGNIALKLDGQWLTPRREAGLLPGIGREQSLREGRVREARLMQSDWRQASEIAWFNALRGWKRACGV
jgi:para-aminobenzoate synthetase/4-amino-4-deoxychorismate lyase